MMLGKRKNQALTKISTYIYKNFIIFLILKFFFPTKIYLSTVKKGAITIPIARIHTAIEPILLLPFQSVIENPIV